MPTLEALGLSTTQERVMLIGAPESVLKEAGKLKPRPSFASTLQVAEPTARMAWWPQRRLLNPRTLSRLGWMLSSARGEAWIVVHPADGEGLRADDVKAALMGTSLRAQEELVLDTGEVAVRVTLGR